MIQKNDLVSGVKIEKWLYFAEKPLKSRNLFLFYIWFSIILITDKHGKGDEK